MIGSDSVGVQAGVQEQKFFKNPCKYWPFQGGSNTAGSTSKVDLMFWFRGYQFENFSVSEFFRG